MRIFITIFCLIAFIFGSFLFITQNSEFFKATPFQVIADGLVNQTSQYISDISAKRAIDKAEKEQAQVIKRAEENYQKRIMETEKVLRQFFDAVATNDTKKAQKILVPEAMYLLNNSDLKNISSTKVMVETAYVPEGSVYVNVRFCAENTLQPLTADFIIDDGQYKISSITIPSD